MKKYFLLPFFLILAACKPSAPTTSQSPTATPTPLQPLPPARQAPSPPQDLPTVYVATTGNDSQNGQQEAPLATVKKAVETLGTQGGVIILREGVYHETFQLPYKQDDDAPLWIMAAPEEKVIFEGGLPITEWKKDSAYPGMFLVHAPQRETMFGAAEYVEVWENNYRIRYRKVADPAGVMAWPGSVCTMDGDQLLIHVRDGRTPLEAELWHNKVAQGVSISKSNVKLVGITFQNYLGGGQARALTLSRGKNINIHHCHFINNTIGISNSGRETHVEDCLFNEVGLGIQHSGGPTNVGIDLVARRCIFQSAAGAFAFSDLGEHVRNGIRIYYPGDGATIEQCVTAGFWAGIYIKTVSGKEGSRPYYIRNNTLIDTLRSGADHKHPRTFVQRNIIGPYVEASGAGPNGSYLRQWGATLKENYYFGHSGKAIEGEINGPEPFVDLVGGDLRLSPKLTFPVPANQLGATEILKVHWNKRLAATLRPIQSEEAPLTITQMPVVTTSREGALISMAFSQKVKPKLLYRVQGEQEWHTNYGLDNQVTRPTSMAVAAPVEPEIITSWRTLFVLLNRALKPDTTYEYRIQAGGGAEKVETPMGTFTTQGDIKTLHVASGAASEKADGSVDTPWAQIQDALDRALPGDKVIIAPGVYTDPILLQHGGTPEHPLIVQGSGMHETILDGGKQVGTMVALNNAPHVHLIDMQVRWFGNIGIHAKNSPYGKAKGLWAWNQSLAPVSGGISGHTLYIEDSPGWDVSYSIFNRAEIGIFALRSPQIKLQHNSAFGNIYAGINLTDSSEGSVVMYNTLNFTGNNSYYIADKKPEAFASLVSDYNNFGTKVRDAKTIYSGGTTIKNIEGIRPENDFTPEPRYGKLAESKFIISTLIGGKEGFFLRMSEWREFSHKDENSIFADPLFVNPSKGDFRLMPGTPNLLPNGEIIGAAGLAEKPSL